jgi:Zn-dependent protease
MEPNAFWTWSALIWRSRTLEMRVSWTLFLWVLFDAAMFAKMGGWWVIPFTLVVAPLSLFLHTMAHIIMARLVGGSAHLTILGAFNDQTSMSLPLTAAKQAAVSGAGPLVSLVLWLSSALLAPFTQSGAASLGIQLFLAFPPPEPLGYAVVGYVAHCNGWIFLLNLLACAIFDGARLWRAVLWPLVGLARAVRWTVFLSYTCSILLMAGSLWTLSVLMFMLGICCLIATVYEHRSVRLGFDPVLQVEYETVHQGRRTRSWFSRWRARRRQLAELARDREEAAEQDLLDRLLAKVSEHGLQALNEQERGVLHKISRRQRERQEAEIP